MDDLSFGLSEPARILRATGVRHLFPADPCPDDSNLVDSGPAGSGMSDSGPYDPGRYDPGSDHTGMSGTDMSGGSFTPGGDALASQPVHGASLLLEDPWPGFLAKVPQNPRSLWTYWDLGADFSGASDPRRGNVLRRLLGALEFPKGSVGFWPCTVLTQGVLCPQPQAFLAGLHRLRPASLVVFGKECFPRLFASDPQALADVSRGVSLYEAPDIMAVLDFDTSQLEAFLGSLKHYYASVFSREEQPRRRSPAST